MVIKKLFKKLFAKKIIISGHQVDGIKHSSWYLINELARSYDRVLLRTVDRDLFKMLISPNVARKYTN